MTWIKYKYWIIGALVAFFGVAIARFGDSLHLGLHPGAIKSVGILISFIGLFLIAIGIRKKNRIKN